MKPRGPVFLAAYCLLLCPLIAQTSSQPQRGPDAGSQTRVAGVEVLPFTGIPFETKDTITWTRPLDGGGTVTTYEESNVARDSSGRIYRERHRFISVGGNPQSTLIESYVLDPIAHTRTGCDPVTRHCVITTYLGRLSFTAQPVGSYANGTRYLDRQSLGPKSIDGIDVIGTLETTSIAPGTIGNDQPLTISREFWYSPSLQTNLAVTRKDPREGVQDIRLSILSRGEPDAKVFAIPSGFTVQDNRRGNR
jgi:hypothetical protein